MKYTNAWGLPPEPGTPRSRKRGIESLREGGCPAWGLPPEPQPSWSRKRGVESSREGGCTQGNLSLRCHSLALAILLLTLLCPSTHADSLFSQRAAKDATTISDKLDRFEPGDIITVLVREELDARTRANLDTKKESDVESTAPAAANQFLVGEKPNGNNILNPGELPNWNIQSENETKNEGDTRRRNTLTTSITCTVKEVYPNGNLMIEGEKQVTVNREDSTVYVSGIIRSKDISAQNTIQSTQVANAVVRVKGKGPLWNNQRRGIITRILDWFSPF